MSPLDLLIHLANFAAPALFLAPCLALAARMLRPGATPGATLWKHSAINAAAGLGVLLAGLWHFGRDGKMLTYAALVLAMATTQWLASRAWR